MRKRVIRPKLGCEILEGRLLLSQTPPYVPENEYTAAASPQIWYANQATQKNLTTQASTGSTASAGGTPFSAASYPAMDITSENFTQSPVYSLIQKELAAKGVGALPATLTPSSTFAVSLPAFSVTTAPNDGDSDASDDTVAPQISSLPAQAAEPLPLVVPVFGPAQAAAGFAYGDGTKIVGTIAAPDPLQLYRIPFDGDDDRPFHLEAEMQGPNPMDGGQLWLMDGQAHVIGVYRLPDTGERLSLYIQSRDLGSPAGSELYMGISADSWGLAPSGAGSLADSASGQSTFSIWVGRDDMSAASSSTILSTTGQQTTSGSSSSTENENSDAETTSVGLGDDSTGPLPTRSAGPSAGVLADGLPIPAVDRNEAAVIDMSLIDLFGQDDAEFAASSWKNRSEPADGLIEIRTPGGLPLLGTALTVPDGNRNESDLDPATTVARNDVPDVFSNHDSDPRKLPEANGPTNTGGAVVIGLGVAASLTYTLLLPDLERKLQPEKPKSRWIWKRKKGV